VEDIPIPDFELPLELQNEEESEFNPEPPKVPISIWVMFIKCVLLQKKLVHRVICGDSRLPKYMMNFFRKVVEFLD
jgi:hypothetical protein